MPYAEYGLTYDFQIIVQTAQGLRPSVPDGSPIELVKVFQACVDAVPARRPDAREVAAMLRACQDEYRKDAHAFLAKSFVAPKKDDTTVAATSAPASAKPGFSGWGKKDDAAASTSASSPAAAGASPAPAKSGFSGWGKKDEVAATPAAAPPALLESEEDKAGKPSGDGAMKRSAGSRGAIRNSQPSQKK